MPTEQRACGADTSHELHQASLPRNKLLSRAVGVITGLQLDTDDLIAATEVHRDSSAHLELTSPQKRVEAAKLLLPQQISTPIIQVPSRFKSTAAGAANADHAYQRSMYSAAEQRNNLLKRAYDVISNLQVQSCFKGCTSLRLPTGLQCFCTASCDEPSMS